MLEPLTVPLGAGATGGSPLQEASQPSSAQLTGWLQGPATVVALKIPSRQLQRLGETPVCAPLVALLTPPKSTPDLSRGSSRGSVEGVLRLLERHSQGLSMASPDNFGVSYPHDPIPHSLHSFTCSGPLPDLHTRGEGPSRREGSVSPLQGGRPPSRPIHPGSSSPSLLCPRRMAA